MKRPNKGEKKEENQTESRSIIALKASQGHH